MFTWDDSLYDHIQNLLKALEKQTQWQGKSANIWNRAIKCNKIVEPMFTNSNITENMAIYTVEQCVVSRNDLGCSSNLKA